MTCLLCHTGAATLYLTELDGEVEETLCLMCWRKRNLQCVHEALKRRGRRPIAIDLPPQPRHDAPDLFRPTPQVGLRHV